jgi:hypothetical protein
VRRLETTIPTPNSLGTTPVQSHVVPSRLPRESSSLGRVRSRVVPSRLPVLPREGTVTITTIPLGTTIVELRRIYLQRPIFFKDLSIDDGLINNEKADPGNQKATLRAKFYS